jgi:hypothetical protein
LAIQWFKTWKGGIGYDVTDLTLATSSDLAVARSLDHMTGTKTDGEQVDLWTRSTVCFRKTDGDWKVMHVHSSDAVPHGWKLQGGGGSQAMSTTGMLSPIAAVKAALQAYVDKDRPAIEAVIGDPYTFTSPLDNTLNRQTYFSRCWPNSKNMTTIQVIHAFEADDRAYVVYEASTAAKRFRNAELHMVRDGRIVATEVYFGWDLPHIAAPGNFIQD